MREKEQKNRNLLEKKIITTIVC